ncbi:T9SS outer membrane translocon Sov/SprA [Alkalitalea saponilacus]|uniref:Cell surface protein SprA n=1 Tax=Alkalitalea saponilacus TaxID=889453 RepID=A0A1T5BYT2_9BACT|nr:cell surface protein SprA [Alkalitalea saponilacus]SKB52286.1 cell surface protein SprA [Alkalitalea saponilacus]
MRKKIAYSLLVPFLTSLFLLAGANDYLVEALTDRDYFQVPETEEQPPVDEEPDEPILEAPQTPASYDDDPVEPIGITPLPVRQDHRSERQNRIRLQDPDNLDYTAEYDPATGMVTMYRKIGNVPVRLPYTMSLEDYQNHQKRRSMQEYWERNNIDQDRDADRGFGHIRVGGEAFESIFGSNVINIRPQGTAELQLGVNRTKIDNPTLQERMRQTTTFDFQQKIQMNIRGNIGERLRLGINYNTEATFDFENQINLEYEGGEDDIIKSIEAGNVSMPLPGTLITGSQSLFGVKTEMQFGKLTITSVFSQQKGETSVMNIQGGAQTQEFDIGADEYDRNRHFFLSHFFRDNYDRALQNLPVVNSPVNITKVEVWVTNRTSNFEQSRNVVAFTDLGENAANISNSKWQGNVNVPPSNRANNLYEVMSTGAEGDIRNFNNASTTLSNIQELRTTRDFERIENARLLTEAEYSLNSRLGYISLNSALNADEILAVAFEYTYNGEVFRVGEFSNSGVEAPNSLIAKLIKGTNLSPRFKYWDLMMKNVYSIGAFQVSPDDFRLNVVHMNDSIGSYLNYFPEDPLNGRLFISIMELDNLNSRLEPTPDGTFDFVPGYTIIPAQGRVIFPVLEPFGSHMDEKLAGAPQDVRNRYVFQELYDSTRTVAAQIAEKNKYRIRGSFKSSAGAEISLNAFNIPRGSVVVTAGGRRLTENVDYSVDYTSGRIRILNQGLMESGTPIQVSLESQSLFNLQTKTLIGTHLDYRFTEDFNVGATVMHLRERPLTQKVAYGNEPIANTIWGLNTSFYRESNLLTSLVNRLPMIQTTAPSSISFEAEFAHLIPGHPNVIDRQGTSYIDDFEGTKIPIDMKHWHAWRLASTPQGQDLFPEAERMNDLSYGYNRARLAWYVIDPLFLRNNNLTPSHLRRDPDSQSNHYVREVFEREIFPNRNTAYGEPTNISVLNLAYYPMERGPYNFDTRIDRDGFLNDPASRWGGIMRAISGNTDFEAANIDHIEFWLMDPFIYDDGTHEGGDFYINLGNVSEDILRDGRKFFEQGLPGRDEPFDVDSTAWGYVPRRQSMVNAFSNDPATRMMQDVGLNGMSSERERQFYRGGGNGFLDQIENMYNTGQLSEEAYNRIMNDPASDDFRYFRGREHDENEAGILERYKYYNNPEGNSRPTEFSGESFSTAATTIPDSEDINGDNTLSESEDYFQYRISLRPEDMNVGENYITDVVESTVTLRNGNTETIKWYQFRVPVNSPDARIGEIGDLRSVRFMRMFLHDFSDTVILRFATLDLVRAEWRRYDRDLFEISDNVTPNPSTQFEVSAVNIEENGNREPVNYILPPGISRVIDPANPSVRELNEQSISLRVTDLASGDARGVYKAINMDMRQYRNLVMDIHAEAVQGYHLQDNEMRAFIRIGSDYQNNYYEYEVPLKLTPPGFYRSSSEAHRYIVWPEENRMNIPLDLFQQIKLRRNDAMRMAGSEVRLTDIYEWFDPENPDSRLKIKGNPNLGNVRTVMIGVRNGALEERTAEVWMNELRLTGFNDRGGWAANSRMNVRLADLGSVQVAGAMSTVGFGSIDQGVTERSQEDFYQYDIATSLELGKFLGPESRMTIPFYMGYSEQVATPEYYPLDPDIPLDVALNNAETRAEKDSIKQVSQDYVRRKSFNFTNVRLQPKDSDVSFYSPSNLSATYSFNETYRRNIDTQYFYDRNYRGILAYNFVNRPSAIEPFSSVSGDALGLIRDFNFYLAPTQVNYRWELTRGYREEQLRSISDPNFHIPVSVNKDFYFNRYFELRYNLTRALSVDFRTTNNAIIDEPDGPVNKDLYRDEYDLWRDSVMTNLLSMGRTTNYQHNINVSYTLPINKLPYMNWTSATLNYGAMYNWQQGPIPRDDFEWGNIIRNSNNIQANTQLNFNTLYNRSPYLRELNRPAGRQQQQQQQQQGETVRYTQHNLQMTQGEPFSINHQLGTSNVTVRVFNENGHPVRGEQNVLDANNMTFTPSQDISSARVMVTGQKVDEKTFGDLLKDYSFRLLTSLRNITITYTENNGTILPGYMPESRFMGTHNYYGSTAPGIPFMMGWQDRDFALMAGENEWLTTDSTLNSPYTMNSTNDLTIRAMLEPIRGLRIDLNANHRQSNNMSEYYFHRNNQFSAFNTRETGNFSMTFNVYRTSFKSVGKRGVYESEVFEQFLLNRQIIADRLGEKRVGIVNPVDGQNNPWEGRPYNPSGYPDADHEVSTGADGYSLTSQQVMIPAFLAAYSGKRAGDIFLDPMPSIAFMRPNWRVTYDGLSRIPWFQKYIRSFDVSHAYRSTYTVGNFMTNMDYDGIEALREGFSFIRNESGNFIPKYEISGVSISEQFTPLIQFNITWLNNMSTRAEIKNGRILNLSLNNNQLIENYSKEYVIGLGYRFDKMDIILGSREGQRQMSSDLNLRADISIRDNFSIIRRIEEGVNQMTAGSRITTLKFTADYVLSDRFNMQLFYDRQLSSPYISTSYPITTSSFGVNFRFSLAQ